MRFLPVLLLTVGYFALRLPWLLCLPLMEAPDEANHIWVTQFLSEHLRAPSGAEVFAAGGVAQYGPLPPFGYLPNALIGHLTPETYFRLGSRIGTLVAGYPTLLAACLLGKQLFTDRFLALALPLLVVLHPQLIFTHSYTNTDGLVTSLCSISILIVVCAIRSGADYRKIFILGFLMGWAALSKANSIALVPAFLFALWRSCQLEGRSRLEAFKLMATFVGTLAVTCGWWYLRNYLEYAGDCLGSRTMVKIWEPSLPVVDGKVVKPWPPIATVSYWRFVFFDFWGLFGFMNRYLWRPLYLIYFALFITTIVGWLQSAVRNGKRIDQPTNQAIWEFFAACVVLNLVAVLYVTVTGVSGPHGRYLFPSELPILAMLLAGFSAFGVRAQRILTGLLLLLCLVSTVSGWLTYYAGHNWAQ